MTNRSQILTISNSLSFFRLLLFIPLWFTLDHLNDNNFRIITFALCIIAAITDFLDGYVARKRNEITEFGKIIDPLADKVLVALIVIKLYLIGEVNSYYFLIIILRDIIIFFGGIIISLKLKKVLPSNLLGKITVTSIGLVFLLIISGIERNNIIFMFFYYSSILLIYGSLVGYIIRGREFIRVNQTR